MYGSVGQMSLIDLSEIPCIPAVTFEIQKGDPGYLGVLRSRGFDGLSKIGNCIFIPLNEGYYLLMPGIYPISGIEALQSEV